MKVKKLIAELQKLPPNALVLQSSDPEGNSIDETFEISIGRFNTDNNELEDEDGDDEIDPKVSVPCIVLWPS